MGSAVEVILPLRSSPMQWLLNRVSLSRPSAFRSFHGSWCSSNLYRRASLAIRPSSLSSLFSTSFLPSYLGLPLPNLDDRVQCLVQNGKWYKEETEACRILVLVLEIREEQFQRCGTIQFEKTVVVLFVRRYDFDAAVLFVHLGDDCGLVRSLVKDCHYMLVLTLLLLLLFFLAIKLII